jgi:polyhydroxyalkanoate synthesis regulator protein
VITVIKYNNRKLYNRETTSYINLGDLVKLPMGSFRVIDHETDRDITTKTLFSFLSEKSFGKDTWRVLSYLYFQYKNAYFKGEKNENL